MNGWSRVGTDRRGRVVFWDAARSRLAGGGARPGWVMVRFSTKGRSKGEATAGADVPGLLQDARAGRRGVTGTDVGRRRRAAGAAAAGGGCTGSVCGAGRRFTPLPGEEKDGRGSAVQFAPRTPLAQKQDNGKCGRVVERDHTLVRLLLTDAGEEEERRARAAPGGREGAALSANLEKDDAYLQANPDSAQTGRHAGSGR